MKELKVIHKWDLKTFQNQLRTLEVVHQDDFGIINFSKYSAKSRPRFNTRTTTLAIRRQTHEHMDDSFSECDTFDSETDQLKARRQNSDKYEKKKGTFKKSQKFFDNHDAKHLLEDNLDKKLPLKHKKEYITLLDREEYQRCKILKAKFIAEFKKKHPT